MFSLNSGNFETNEDGFIALDDYAIDINDELTHKNSVRLLTKCGEILMTKSVENLELSLRCLYCQNVYDELEEFRQHLIGEHLSVQQIYDNYETQLVHADADEEETNEIQIEVKIERVEEENILPPEENILSLADVVANDVEPSSEIKEFKYKCDECPKSFKTKYNLETHLYSHSVNKPYKCKICPRSYANKQNLIVHTRRHTGTKPYECKECFRCFASSTERKIHLRCHTGEKPHVCIECGKDHATASQLVEHHRSVHLEERKFTCNFCSKVFYTKKHLQSHQEAIHSMGPETFVCKICNLYIKTEFYLKAHMKIHSEKKSYACPYCGRLFGQHSGLNHHIKTHKKKGDIERRRGERNDTVKNAKIS